MRRIALFALLCVIVLSTSAFADSLWAENWESYTSGSTPYGSWSLGNGSWLGLAPVNGQAKDTQAYTITGGSTSRIGKGIGSDLSNATQVVLDAYFYDSNGATSTKRSFIGFQNAFTVDTSMLRIGMNNNADYQVHYFSTALQTVDTGVSNSTGWHHVTLTNTKIDATNWRTDWALDDASGNFTWAWSAAGANNIVLGYNYSCGNEVDWDNISVSATTTPEPGSLLALGSGIIGLVGFVIRRRA